MAVIDSGIEPGVDFDNRITAFYDFTHGDIRAVRRSIRTATARTWPGLIASEFVGVAPNARLIGLRVLDEKGQGDTANVVRAIEFAIANKDLLGIDVLNLSLGHPIYEPAATDPLVQAVEHATREGHRRRGLRRQLRPEQEDRPSGLCAASRRPATRRRR